MEWYEIFLIYMLGYVIGYYLVRYDLKRNTSDIISWTWSDVRFCALIAVFSWILVPVFLMFQIMHWVQGTNNRRQSKPPKWL